MGKLSALPPRLGALPPRLARQTDVEGHSATLEPWRKWYHLARWKHPQRGLRIRVLIRDLFTCQAAGCHRTAPSPHLVADHIEPHRGDERLFWDETNLQTLCKPCHDGRKQALDRAGRP